MEAERSICSASPLRLTHFYEKEPILTTRIRIVVLLLVGAPLARCASDTIHDYNRFDSDESSFEQRDHDKKIPFWSHEVSCLSSGGNGKPDTERVVLSSEVECESKQT